MALIKQNSFGPNATAGKNKLGKQINRIMRDLENKLGGVYKLIDFHGGATISAAMASGDVVIVRDFYNDTKDILNTYKSTNLQILPSGFAP